MWGHAYVSETCGVTWALRRGLMSVGKLAGRHLTWPEDLGTRVSMAHELPVQLLPSVPDLQHLQPLTLSHVPSKSLPFQLEALCSEYISISS